MRSRDVNDRHEFIHVWERHFNLLRYALVDGDDNFHRWCLYDEEDWLSNSLVGVNAVGRITSLDKRGGGAFLDLGEGLSAYLRYKESRLREGDLLPVCIDRDLRNFGDKGLRVVYGFRFRNHCVRLQNASHKHAGIFTQGSKDRGGENELCEHAKNLWQQNHSQISLHELRLTLAHNSEPQLRSPETREALLIANFNNLASSLNQAEALLTATNAKPQLIKSDSVLWQALTSMPSIKAPMIFAQQSLYNDAHKLVNTLSPTLISNSRICSQQEISDLCGSTAVAQLYQNLEPTILFANQAKITIDETEAATIIDIDSGKEQPSSKAQQGESGILNFNLKAAQEITRLIGLLDLAGIIIVDFIRMKNPQNQKTLLQKLRSLCSRNHLHADILGYSKCGFIEIIRTRNNSSLKQTLLSNHKNKNLKPQQAYKLTLCSLSHIKQTTPNINSPTIITADSQTINLIKQFNQNKSHNLNLQFIENNNCSIPIVDKN